MRYLSLSEVLFLHERLVATSGGTLGIRDLSALESAVNQSRATFDRQELYPDLASKAACFGYSLIRNHPFIDGNKRVGHAAMETFLLVNGCEITASMDEQERTVLDLAAGKVTRELFTSWVRHHITTIPG